MNFENNESEDENSSIFVSKQTTDFANPNSLVDRYFTKTIFEVGSATAKDTTICFTESEGPWCNRHAYSPCADIRHLALHPAPPQMAFELKRALKRAE